MQNSNLPVRRSGQCQHSKTLGHFYVRRWRPLISPSSCSRVLDAMVTHTKHHTQSSLSVLWSRGLNLSTAKQDWRKKFLIRGFSEAATKEVVCWIFFSSLAPLRAQSSELTTAKATVTVCWKSNHWSQYWKHKYEAGPALLAHDAVPRS